jgi:hypothetical protein
MRGSDSDRLRRCQSKDMSGLGVCKVIRAAALGCPTNAVDCSSVPLLQPRVQLRTPEALFELTHHNRKADVAAFTNRQSRSVLLVCSRRTKGILSIGRAPGGRADEAA